MRLIDADALKSCYTGSNGLDDKASYESIRKMIDVQPTAYDVEKVVNELEKHKADFKKDVNSCDKRDIAEHCRKVREKRGNCIGLDCFECVFDMAIEIVKGGGIDDNMPK